MKALNVQSVDVCPWALREGIVLHYLQSMHNESFDLPLRPLARMAVQEGEHGQRGTGDLALVATLPRDELAGSSVSRPDGLDRSGSGSGSRRSRKRSSPGPCEP
jgi:hypothetical protein